MRTKNDTAEMNEVGNNIGPCPEDFNESEELFQAFTDESLEWVKSDTSIPGALAPICYFGPFTAIDFSEILDRQIVLAEAKRMAQPDGEMRICATTGKLFQPVAYIPFCPHDDFARQARHEADILTATLTFGGQFFPTEDGELLAVSGGVYYYNKNIKRYRYAHQTSPLVQMAMRLAGKNMARKWGKTLEEAERIQMRNRRLLSIKLNTQAIAKRVKF